MCFTIGKPVCKIMLVRHLNQRLSMCLKHNLKMISQEESQVKNFFIKNNIILSDEWLSSCISWIKENDGNCTLKDLQSKVYEQWLLLDFRDVSIPILPPNITQEKKYVISTNMCLQVMCIIDISKPKLAQIMNIRNAKSSSHCTDDLHNKRVLQLTLSDGVQEILATEYKPVPCLNINLSAGIKIKLIAPVTVRRGQIMLESGNIQILGGEVEEILISNAAENVLAKCLGMPLNENPTIMQETFETADRDMLERTSYTLPSTNSSYQTKLPQHSRDNTVLPNVSNHQLPQYQSTPQTQSKHLDTSNLFNDEFEEMDFEQIDQVASICDKQMPTKQAFKSDNNYDSDDFDEMMKLEEELKSPVSASVGPSTSTVPVPFDIPTAPLGPPTRKPMSIERLLSLRKNVTKGKFCIEAKYKSIIERLSSTSDSFSIKISVSDETGDIEVMLHTDIISDMLGYDPEALEAIKERIRNGDQASTDVIYKAFVDFRNKIFNLNSKMDVLIESGKEPIIVKFLE